MTEYIKRKTLRLRHKIVKHLVPKLYEDWLLYGGTVADDIPRPMIKATKVHFNSSVDLVGIEIGVFEGVNALSILRELPIKRLYLVDPYIDLEHYLYIMRERLSRFPQTLLIKKLSKDAINEIPEHVDFVYIDGDHSYDCVKNDIAMYYNITKDNGLVGGHDYRSVHEGVTRAVDEFVSERHLKLFTSGHDWWVMK